MTDQQTNYHFSFELTIVISHSSPYVSVDSVNMCDSWGTEIANRFQSAGSGVTAARAPTYPIPGRWAPYEWGLKAKCSASFNGTGQFYSLYPLGWFKITPRYQEFDMNYERGVCFPSTCSKEHVLLLMSDIKPSEFGQMTTETVYQTKGNAEKISSKQITGIVGQKVGVQQVVYVSAVLELMPREIRRNDSGIRSSLKVPKYIQSAFLTRPDKSVLEFSWRTNRTGPAKFIVRFVCLLSKRVHWHQAETATLFDCI